MNFDKTHMNIHLRITPFCSSLPDQLSRLCPTHFWIQYVWTFYSYWHFTIWTFSNSSNFYGHFITMDNLPYGFFTHRSLLLHEINRWRHNVFQFGEWHWKQEISNWLLSEIKRERWKIILPSMGFELTTPGLRVQSKLYTPSTLNIVLIQWHTHWNVCAVK